MEDRTEEDPFTRLARYIGTDAPFLIGRLLDAHPAEGECYGCRVPGARPPMPAPCSIRRLALLAAQEEARRIARDPVTKIETAERNGT